MNTICQLFCGEEVNRELLSGHRLCVSVLFLLPFQGRPSCAAVPGAAVGVQFVFPESIILTSHICLQTTVNTLKRPDEVFC